MVTIPLRQPEYERAHRAGAQPVLVVDLDGTLIKTDLLVESMLALLKRSPFSLPLLAMWLAKGKANLKERIAERVEIDARALPYNEEFLAFLRGERAAGRTIWLATASARKFAERIADHLGIFDRILATHGGKNLAGRAKLDALVSDLGPKEFRYAGNAVADLQIWPKATSAVVVNPERGVEKALAGVCAVEKVFRREKPKLSTYLQAIRLYQWLKNFLIFVPLVLAHRWSELPLLMNCVIGFFAFSLTASSAYVVNDLLDVTADRHHPRKRSRPFASGELPISTGVWLALVLLLGAAALSSLLPWQFSLVLATYYAGTLAYSFKLKHHAMVDVTTLAGLYTLRVIAGVVISAAASFWLLAFSIFIFLSLALIKRYSELKVMQSEGKQEAPGRGYEVGDLTILSSAGIASGYIAALVLALYVNSPEVLRLYRFPEAIWLLCCLLLYWVSRMWMITHRGDMHDDPIIFALKDGPSLVIAALGVGITIAAML